MWQGLNLNPGLCPYQPLPADRSSLVSLHQTPFSSPFPPDFSAKSQPPSQYDFFFFPFASLPRDLMSNPILLLQPCSPLLPTWTPVFPKLCNSFFTDPEFDPSLFLLLGHFPLLFCFFSLSSGKPGTAGQTFSLLFFFIVFLCEYFVSGLFLISVLWGRVNSSNPSFFLWGLRLNKSCLEQDGPSGLGEGHRPRMGITGNPVGMLVIMRHLPLPCPAVVEMLEEA